MNKRIKVFEAFAGIGAQASALKRAKINYEIVGISEWFIDAIICYDQIHNNDKPIPEIPDRETMLEYLNKYTFSKDSAHPASIDKLPDDQLKQLFIANKRCKNYGSITQLQPSELPEIDLLVYSFPCQDLSTGGKNLGMSKGSGTRSGLLWEVERILAGLHQEGRLPEYLLLENVRNILSPNNSKDLNAWLEFLESIGYSNDPCMVLNALDFGVPQDRERAFIVSHLNTPAGIPDLIKKKDRVYDTWHFFKNDYSNPVYEKEADEAKLNRTPSREKMWEINGRPLQDQTTIRTITCNMDRTHCCGLFLYKDSYRRPTIREAFLLMGFEEKDYELSTELGYSYRKMNKLIGNSIVVDVLTEVFECMFKRRNGEV